MILLKFVFKPKYINISSIYQPILIKSSINLTNKIIISPKNFIIIILNYIKLY